VVSFVFHFISNSTFIYEIILKNLKKRPHQDWWIL